MQPKSLRVVPQKKDVKFNKAETKQLEKELTATPKVEEKIPQSYEQRLEKMNTRQLRGEVRRGIRGKLSGYNAIAESVVLDVILDSFERGIRPVVG